MTDAQKPAAADAAKAPQQQSKVAPTEPKKVPEIGGPKGPDPTRYGDWERNGRCVDF